MHWKLTIRFSTTNFRAPRVIRYAGYGNQWIGLKLNGYQWHITSLKQCEPAQTKGALAESPSTPENESTPRKL